MQDHEFGVFGQFAFHKPEDSLIINLLKLLNMIPLHLHSINQLALDDVVPILDQFQTFVLLLAQVAQDLQLLEVCVLGREALSQSEEVCPRSEDAEQKVRV